MVTFRRIVLTGLRNYVRNSWLTIAATAVMVVATTIILVAIVLNVTAQNAISELSKNLTISVYLNDGTSVDARQELQREFTINQYVASVDYVDKQEAQTRFSQTFADDEGVIEGFSIIGGDSLPESLEISVNNLDFIEEVGAIAETDKYEPIVDSVSLGKVDARKTIDRAKAAQTFIVRASVVSSLVFAAVSVLIIFNTIRMAIFTRSEEIRIMKLIGATPTFIRGPFLVEASLYGVVAGSISFAAVYTMIVSLGSRLSTQPEFIATYNLFREGSTIAYMLIFAILGGILVGVISSMLAMERYLRLKNW